MSDDAIYNPMRERSFSEIMQARYSRRQLLGGIGKLGALAALGAAIKPGQTLAETLLATGSGLTFTEIRKNTSTTHRVAPGYDARLLIRWGDPMHATAPDFEPLNQSGEAQLQQFGYNNDFIAFMPYPYGSRNSNHGLLCVNHEYASSYMMFPDLPYDETIALRTSRKQVEVEMAAHGYSILEIQKNNGHWEQVIGSPYSRRHTPSTTDFAISGPASGHPRMRTKNNPRGMMVRGSFANCGGGVTPWGTVLTCEENFDPYFMGTLTDSRETENYSRYGLGTQLWYGWGRFEERFDVGKEPHEPNRFGWVVEYDPYDPSRQPVKRTALGRFKHETATTVLAPDGRVVIYSGDDERFEYIYRFITKGKYDSKNREANFSLLDEGVLSVARFHEDGSMEWLPLIHGLNGLTKENGFANQGDVVIEARRAGDIVGATPMDRPEGIAVHPVTGQVFVSLSNNIAREKPNIANPRTPNIYGHIIELLPPELDHTAPRFAWKIFLRGGDPAAKSHDALYHSPVSKEGWLSCPDNLAIDPSGRLWIATDDQPKTIGINDGLYAAETTGTGYGGTRLFFTGPQGCEITGPCFTPDGKTLFLSVQHPGDSKISTFEDPLTRWPDFDPDMPPRPAVIAITKQDGEVIGG